MYTTALKVRKILPGLLIDDEDLGIPTSLTITLSRPALAVSSILLDTGAVLTDETGFTFARPRTITLSLLTVDTNHLATCHYSISDTDLESIIGRADRRIDTYFSQYNTPPAEYCDDWSSLLSAAMYLREYATATEENLNRAKALEDQAMQDMEMYRDNADREQPTRSNYNYVVKSNG
jgi:hypothetical protein